MKDLQHESKIEANQQITLLTENLKSNPHNVQLSSNFDLSLFESFNFENIENKSHFYLKKEDLGDQIEKHLKAEKGIR